MGSQEKNRTKLVTPKQPFFVLSLNEYYKVPVMNYGISHFYCYRTDDSPERSNIMAVPDACVDLICYCRKGAGKAFFYGTVFEPEDIQFEPDSYIFGVRFLPCHNPLNGVFDLFRQLAREKVLHYRDVLSNREMIDRIAETEDFRCQIDIFMEAYLKYYIPAGRGDGIVSLSEFVVGEVLKNSGNVKFEDIAEDAGYSTRYLSRVFKEKYGFSPKTLTRIVRFQTMLNVLCVGKEPDFSEFAVDLGFSDQSHMIKDFKEFVNLTPRKYLNALNQGNYSEKLIIL